MSWCVSDSVEVSLPGWDTREVLAGVGVGVEAVGAGVGMDRR